jgi:hypothetical protein
MASDPKGDLVTMASFKDPSFQKRVGQSADAKKKALEQLRLRPPRDEKIVAERKVADLRRQTAKVQKAVAKNAAAKAVAESKAEAVVKAAAAPVPTDAERKAARDARYAARKNRR